VVAQVESPLVKPDGQVSCIRLPRYLSSAIFGRAAHAIFLPDG